jgi:hypothetical protein
MSEESEAIEDQEGADVSEQTSEPSAVVDSKVESTQTTDEAKQAADQDRLEKTFRLIPGEEVLLTKRPSVFAFVPMYVVGVLSLLIHYAFSQAENLESENLALDLLYRLMALDFGEALPFGFAFTMLGLAWLNRLLNVSTSGRWVTIYLLMVGLTPFVIQIDDLITMIGGLVTDNADYGNFIPFDYSYMLFGLGYFAVFMGLTYYYQRSFHYAIIFDAVIFEYSFLLSRSH